MSGQVELKVHGSKLSPATGVCQRYMLAPDSFATSMDWMLERTVGQGTNGVSFGQESYTDLDFTDDVSLMAELLELLISVLETMASEATSQGFEVNWQKTKIQALGTRVNVPSTITDQGQQVAVVDQYVLSTRQHKALPTSYAAVVSLMQRCRV